MKRMVGTHVAVALLAGVIGAAGCSSAPPNPPPKTYPAKGQVISRATGKPLTGGLVEFTTTGNQPVSVQGEIKPDGSFTVVTLHDKQRVDGAPEGSYRVSVVPPQTDKQEPGIPLELVVQVKPEGPNDFKIEVP
jgi:hypothetical protein